MQHILKSAVLLVFGVAGSLSSVTEHARAADPQPSAQSLPPAVFRPVDLETRQHEGFTAYLFTGEHGDNQTYDVAANDEFVYVGTEKGLYRYEKATESWSKVGRDEQLPGEMVWELAADEDHLAMEVMVREDRRNYVRSAGVYWLDQETGQWSLIDKSADGLQMLDGKLWSVGYRGATRIDPESEIRYYYDDEDEPLFKGNRVYGVATDGEDIWVAIGGKLNRELHKFLGGGVAHYDTAADQWESFTVKDGLASEYTTGVAADHREAWVAHWDEEVGLSVLDRRKGKWTALRKSVNGVELGGPRIALDKKYVWVGQQRGLVRLDRRSREALFINESRGLPGYIVSGLAVTDDSVWAAAYTYGPGGESVRNSGVIFIPSRRTFMAILMKRLEGSSVALAGVGVLILGLGWLVWRRKRRARVGPL